MGFRKKKDDRREAEPKERIVFYCGQCGKSLAKGWATPGLYWLRCTSCDTATPVFRHEVDAVRYYKEKYGLTYEVVKEVFGE